MRRNDEFGHGVSLPAEREPTRIFANGNWRAPSANRRVQSIAQMAARRHFAREQIPKKATPHAAMPMVLSRPLAAARIARLRGCAPVYPESMSPSHTANGAAPRSAGMSGQMHLDDLFGDAPASEEGGAPANDAQPRMAIARRLKHAREQASYETASAAAIAFGWAPSRYLAHESGERPIASKQLAIYAAAFAVDYRWLQQGD